MLNSTGPDLRSLLGMEAVSQERECNPSGFAVKKSGNQSRGVSCRTDSWQERWHGLHCRLQQQETPGSVEI